jgi:iron complex outermembrane receptor protein
MYEPWSGASAYASYSQSFNPQVLYDVENHLLPPLQGTQYEVGFKYRLAGAGLLLSGALFRITQKNAGEFVEFDSFPRYQAIGQVKHQGIEISALGQMTPRWQVNAGYTYLEATIDSDVDVTLIGRPELYLSKHTGSVFSTYTFAGPVLRGLTLGGGIHFTGSQPTAYDGSSRPVPSYCVTDATAEFARGMWHTQLNVHNVFDKHYYINSYGSLLYGNIVGQPTKVALTLQRVF